MTDFTTLREAAQQWGVLMGSQFKHDLVIGDDAVPEYISVHSEQYEVSTVGNDCKWAATHPYQYHFTLDKCLDSFAYAQSATQHFRGHNLCWGNNNPKWLLDGGFSADELSALL
jgi:endo-1,4-beta-xylanase